mmetsp:Transcript_45489/g.106325  ORF Transcript_45489/g.106325 Transcript_45489/m.106325 type:complete len:247 (+) Transcript_45489:13-753(+)
MVQKGSGLTRHSGHSELLDWLHLAQIVFILRRGRAFHDGLLVLLGHSGLVFLLVFVRLGLVESHNALIAQASANVDAIAAALLLLGVAPAVLLLAPSGHVALLVPDVDLLAHVPPAGAIRSKEDPTDLADPAEGRLSLTGGEQEALPHLDLLLEILLVICANMLLTGSGAGQRLVAKLAADQVLLHLQDISSAESRGLRLVDALVDFLVHLRGVVIRGLRLSFPRRGGEDWCIHHPLVLWSFAGWW